jgi:GntR family transcriptional regulator
LTGSAICYTLSITDGALYKRTGYGHILQEVTFPMLVEIDFNSEEAIYLQLRDQIILMIATASLSDGQVLPSVRQLADEVGINMHTVNKTYSLLKQEGFIKVDRRKGAVVSVDEDKLRAKAEVDKNLRVILAEAVCRNLTRSDIHKMVDEIYDEYGGS